MLIRQVQPHELEVLKVLVQTVVDETYGGLWAMPPLPIGDDNWSMTTIAVIDNALVGMVLTSSTWMDDLWVLREYRGRGVGWRLLKHGEAEITARGFDVMRLRVVKSKKSAVTFYERFGWHVQGEFLHETFSVLMLEMHKVCRAG